MSEWTKLGDDRIITTHDCGFMIVMPTDEYMWVPISCPVCDLVMRGIEDTITYRNYECCSECSLMWAEGNSAMWKGGWRPDRKMIQMYVARRRNASSYRVK